MKNSIGTILLFESLGLGHLINERKRLEHADREAKRLGKLAAKQIAISGQGGAKDVYSRRQYSPRFPRRTSIERSLKVNRFATGTENPNIALGKEAGRAAKKGITRRGTSWADPKEVTLSLGSVRGANIKGSEGRESVQRAARAGIEQRQHHRQIAKRARHYDEKAGLIKPRNLP
jgi:hypothetical protein